MTQEYLKSRLFYDYSNGKFYWIKARRGIRKGSEAGTNFNGYIALKMDGKRYLMHRLAWLYHYGEFPKYEIDHINRIRHDNRIENLRDVPHYVNMNNRKPNLNRKQNG